MSNRVLAPLLLAFVLVAALAGYGFASSDDESVIEAAMGSAVESALAAVTPEPTPEPTPIPTPWIVAAPECMDAINGLMVQSLPSLDFLIAVYDAYLDFPDESLAQFGKRVEDVIRNAEEPPNEAEQNATSAFIDACRDAS